MTPAAPAAAPLRWQQAIIERIVARTPRVASVFVRSALAAHEAGQHVDVRLTAPDGYQAQRSYSIASPPGSSSIELAIERLADGEVSPYFHDVARPGDAFEMRGPIGGHFVWRRDDGGPLAMIAGGSGVVPLAAMLRHRAAVASGTPTLLVYSSRTWDDIVFRDELVAMQSSDPSFRLVLITTREPRRRAGDSDRRFDRTLLRHVLAAWGHEPKHVYVCGSNGFVEAAASSLVLEGVAAARVRTERYGGP